MYHQIHTHLCIRHRVQINIGERRTTFTKAYGIKVRCYWELFKEHAKNLGTFCFEGLPPPSPPQQIKTPKKKTLAWKVHYPSGKWTMDSPLSTPNTTFKQKPSLTFTHKKNGEAPYLHYVTSHWLHGNFILKIKCHYFWPKLITYPKNTLLIMSNNVGTIIWCKQFIIYVII
jgi:hypothetical protein